MKRKKKAKVRPHSCRVMVLAGHACRVRGAHPMCGRDVEMLTELVRAAIAHMAGK